MHNCFVFFFFVEAGSNCKKFRRIQTPETSSISNFLHQVFSILFQFSVDCGVFLFFFQGEENHFSYADNGCNHITGKGFKGYFSKQRIEEKTAQQSLSTVEDSDILFLSIPGCASLLSKQIYLGHMPKPKMWSMCSQDYFVAKEIFLPEKELSKTDATVINSLILATLDAEKFNLIRM